MLSQRELKLTLTDKFLMRTGCILANLKMACTWLSLGIVVTLCAYPVESAFAQNNRIALVIGNADYKQISKLDNPVNDAEDIAKALKGFGFEVIFRKNETKRGMTDALAELGRKAKGAEAALLYYAGHGMQVRGENYLLPVNVSAGSEAAIIDESVSVNRVLDELEGGARINMVMLDACRDNPITGKFRSVGRGLAATTSVPKGTVIVYATDPGNTAADGETGGRNGLFTASMLRALQGKDLSLQGVLTSASAEVDRASKGKQTPYVNGPPHVQRNFHFRVTVEVEPGPVSLEKDFWASMKDSNDADDFQAYLQKYPNGSYRSLAENKLKRLNAAKGIANGQNVPGSAAAVPLRPPVAIAAREGLPKGQTFQDCKNCPEMVSIPSGFFMMGTDGAKRNAFISSGGSAEYVKWESPVHQVNVPSFAAGKYPVTRGQFAAFVNATAYKTEAEQSIGCFIYVEGAWRSDVASNWRNVGFSQADDHPVVCVTWNDAQAYIDWLNQLPDVRKSGNGAGYRLLAESEREYATRAGSVDVYWWGDTFQTNKANYFKADEKRATVAVQNNSSNLFGMYSVHGNTWDWVEDCFHDSYVGAPVNGSAWTTGCTTEEKVLRGGSWTDVPRALRSAHRSKNIPIFRVSFVGFRVAKSW